MSKRTIIRLKSWLMIVSHSVYWKIVGMCCDTYGEHPYCKQLHTVLFSTEVHLLQNVGLQIDRLSFNFHMEFSEGSGHIMYMQRQTNGRCVSTLADW